MKITREDVKGFPYFFNHKSARRYLQGKYGEFFVMFNYGFDIKGQKYYDYHLVKNRKRYVEWREMLMEGKEVDSRLYEDTYQYCRVYDNGKFYTQYENTINRKMV